MRNYETKTFTYFDNRRGCHTTKAATTYAGKTVSAFAYTNPGDAHDEETGSKIANLRLNIKIGKKRAKSMRNRAANYENLIRAYEAEIKRMRKEIPKALSAAGDRMVEVHQYEEELASILANLG